MRGIRNLADAPSARPEHHYPYPSVPGSALSVAGDGQYLTAIRIDDPCGNVPLYKGNIVGFGGLYHRGKLMSTGRCMYL
jgi:hypothetical protein